MRKRGFTLVELLVVVGIIAVLIGILLPVLASVRERGQRTVCASRLKEIVHGIHMFANENKGKLPEGKRDFDGAEHCVWISQNTYETLAKFAGYRLTSPQPPPAGTVGDPFLTCPNLEAPTPRPSYAPPHGWVIGYTYLANHPAVNQMQNTTPPTPPVVRWVSPMRINESASRPLIADWVGQDVTMGSWISVPHRRGGNGGFLFPPPGVVNPTPKSMGATGGNVAYLDGSVRWTNVDDLRQRADSQFGYQYLSWW
jgi:prepilin-type N-terminal cleavage/methylation domain-containing protein/prepilin-type processing-associated H-X9-DG protein